ncbi:PfkB family carbohydrate kinase [Romboutsia sp. 1001713B170207_170306_H8]|uniref:PfkB family carbohydrate kinase n=1 Tax=Romboutsia sp. 1001713B170207_170306_H8 TaxID=2787112 RepID=UPI00189A85B8|nr:PfkB family carbohydrate kinase [Romboutsia sp. 1001713B170207_170306_H8]
MKTLIIGNVYVDIIINVDHLPKTGDDIVCKKHIVTVGGCAYNVATILKNFNIDHTLVFPVGNGIYGSIIENEVIKSGYKPNIKVDSGDNGYCMCLVEESGERSFITVKGIETNYSESWFEGINPDDYKNIYISGYEMEGESGQIISNWISKLEDKNIFFAPGHRMGEIEKETLDKILKLRPIIHINEEEALSFTNKKSIVEAARAINKITKNTVFITLGKDGVMCANNCEYRFVDSFDSEIKNTIGAGDSHMGAIIAGYSMGYNLGDCCYFANKVASKVVSIEESRLEEKYFDIKEYNII